MAAAASGTGGTRVKPIPFFKRKFPRSGYLNHGDPVPINYKDLKFGMLQDWKEIDESKKEMWEDSRSVVKQKNKKREFRMDPNDPDEIQPLQLPGGRFRMRIEILNVHYKGFLYTDEADDPLTLQRNFWPVVEQLLAHFFSPKIPQPPVPPLGDEDDNIENREAGYHIDALARLQLSYRET